MKVNIIKEHAFYPLGEADVSEARGNYLICVGIAEKAKEKKEFKPAIEKVEITKPATKKKQ